MFNEDLINEIKLNREEVVEAVKDSKPDLTDKIEELKDRLRKGMDWFSAIDPIYWSDEGFSDKKVKNGKSLEEIKPDIFANGGDRATSEVPETPVCKKFNIKMVDGLGDKIRSSSSLTGLDELS